MFNFQSKKKNIYKKKIELKSKKKKIWNKTKPTASPTEQTHPRILKKKKKTNIESEIKLTHDHVAAENTEKTNPQYTEIVYTDYNLQTKSKTNQKQYCVYQKKKKNPIQSLCTKTAKPNQKNPNTRSFVTVTRSSSSSP